MGLIDWVGFGDASGWRLRAGFTARSGGRSVGAYDSLNLGFHVGDEPGTVAENRALVGRCVPGLAWMDQVHGDNVELALAGSIATGTDALLVDPVAGGGTAAAVMVADCIPLLLLSVDRPLAAAVHVGRSGLLAGIAAKAVGRMRSRGAGAIRGFVGPSICGSCYEVPEPMRAQAETIAPGAAATTSWGTPSIDIPGALRRQLHGEGIEDIAFSEICTFEDSRYFSHRRARAGGERAGRFAGIVEVTRDTPK